MDKSELFLQIDEALPDLNPSTRKTYRSLLVNHYIKHRRSECTDILEFYGCPEMCIESLRARPLNTQATILAAAFSLTKLPEYHTQMHSISGTIKENYKDQDMTEKRKEVVLTKKEVEAIYKAYVEKYAESPTARNATDLLITGLMSGVFPELPPRRLMEYTELKTTPPPPLAKGAPRPMFNYLVEGPRGRILMVLFRHKTSKGGKNASLLPIPKGLAALVRKMSREGREFLLLNDLGEKFTSASLHARLMSIYGFGVDMLRSIFLSDMHKDTPSLRRMEKVARDMGNSVNAQVMCYVKN